MKEVIIQLVLYYMRNSESQGRWWGRMGQWRSRAEPKVLHHCQLFVNNREVALVKGCVWTALIDFTKKGKKKELIHPQTELVVPVCSCSQQVSIFKKTKNKKKPTVYANKESSTLSLCAELAFYMDGGESWGAFNNPLIHWGIQVVKRLSQMELGRATKYVMSSESAVSMVRNDFCCSVWREEDREGEF